MNIQWWLIQNGLTVALLLPAVWCLSWVFRWRPACQHWLWLLLLIKLVLPPIIEWPYAISPLKPIFVSSSVTGLTENLADHSTMGIPLADVRTEPGEVANLNETTRSTASSQPNPLAKPFSRFAAISTFLQNLQAVWLLGCLVQLYFAGRRIIATSRLLKGSKPPTPTLKKDVARMADRFRMRPVATRISRHIISPNVVALGRVIVLWPERLAEGRIEKKVEPILAHELAHLLRRDHWVAWLELCVGIVWWWNPLCWLICRKLHETRELACDAMALQITEGTPHDYAMQLLEMTTSYSESTRQLPIYGIGAVSHLSLKARLKMVFERRQNARTSFFGAVMIATLALTLIPAWSSGGNSPQTKSKAKTAAPSTADRPRDKVTIAKDDHSPKTEVESRTPVPIPVQEPPLAVPQEKPKLEQRDEKVDAGDAEDSSDVGGNEGHGGGGGFGGQGGGGGGGGGGGFGGGGAIGKNSRVRFNGQGQNGGNGADGQGRGGGFGGQGGGGGGGGFGGAGANGKNSRIRFNSQGQNGENGADSQGGGGGFGGQGGSGGGGGFGGAGANGKNSRVRLNGQGQNGGKGADGQGGGGGGQGGGGTNNKRSEQITDPE